MSNEKIDLVPIKDIIRFIMSWKDENKWKFSDAKYFWEFLSRDLRDFYETIKRENDVL